MAYSFYLNVENAGNRIKDTPSGHTAQYMDSFFGKWEAYVDGGRFCL